MPIFHYCALQLAHYEILIVVSLLLDSPPSYVSCRLLWIFIEFWRDDTTCGDLTDCDLNKSDQCYGRLRIADADRKSNYTISGRQACQIEVRRLFRRPRLEIRACIRLSASTIQIPFSEHLPEQ